MDTIIRWCNRVNSQTQTEEEVRIIRFGALLLLENVTRLLLLLVLGIFVGEGKETAIFLIVFCSIRLQVGGYHAQTSLGCMGCMLIAWGIALLGSKMSITFFYKIIFTVLCLSVIVITAPRTSNRKYYTQRIILEKN